MQYMCMEEIGVHNICIKGKDRVGKGGLKRKEILYALLILLYSHIKIRYSQHILNIFD